MSTLRIASAIACALACSAVLAQPLAPPDPAKFPALASLVEWLKGSAKEPRNCSVTVAMTLAAREAYEKTKSEEQAADAIARGIVAASKGKLDDTRAQFMAAGYVRTAQQFMPLPTRAAAMAIAQLCRTSTERGDRPFANAELVTRLVNEARACTASGFSDASTNHVPLECVVRTMAMRP